MKLVVLLIALLVPTAAMAGKCDEDKQKFCKDVIEAKGDVRACLTQHLAELSDDCKAKQEAKAKKAEKKDSAKSKKEDEAQLERKTSPAPESDSNQADQPIPTAPTEQ